MSVFVAQLFPKDKVKDIKGASQAGINFCHGFIDAIQPDTVYAYQINSEGKKLQLDFQNKRIEYICFRGFPHKSIFKALNVVIENITIVREIIRKKENNIWFYNLTPQVILAFIILKILLRKKCFILVADFTPELFRNKIALKLMKLSNGVISLTPELKKLIGNGIPVLVKAGIIDESHIVTKTNTEVIRNKFLFSGSLSKYTGIELALDVFAQLPEMELFISGTGQSIDVIKEYCEKYPNIHYCGYLDFKEYLSLLDSVDFVLSLRDISLGKNNYNFPSKIVEYLINKKIVISTKQYETLDNDIYFYCDYELTDLKEKVLFVNHLPNDKINLIRDDAQKFAMNSFSKRSWKEKVHEIENIGKI